MAETSVDDLLALGQIAIDVGRWEQAQSYFEQALRLDQTNAQAQRGITLVKERLGKLGEAVEFPMTRPDYDNGSSQGEWTIVKRGSSYAIEGNGDGWIFNRTFPTKWKAELAIEVFTNGGRVSDYWKEARRRAQMRKEATSADVDGSQSTTRERAVDVKLDALEPRTLEEFVGQERIKELLRIQIEAAKARGDALDHILLCAPVGQGKRTLAKIIAREMDANIKITSGPAIKRAGGLAVILTNLRKGDILFIDEVHRLSRVVEEVLHPAMEDFALDLVIGKGSNARSIRLSLPRFTIIGATKDRNSVSALLFNRFSAAYEFDPYSNEALAILIRHFAGEWNVPIEDAAAYEIAQRCRGRISNAKRLLKQARDYAQVKGDGTITPGVVKAALGTRLGSALVTPDSDVSASPTVGYIYLLENPSMGGLVKIGKTKRNPHERAKELGAVSGVPTPFILRFHIYVDDCTGAEKYVHARLDEMGYRVSDGREFFEVPVNVAKKIMLAAQHLFPVNDGGLGSEP